MSAWVERELGGCEFPDRRLKNRLGKLLGDLGQRIGDTLPMACRDWAATKAAYRFLDNPRVDEGTILGGHFAATKARFAATTGTTLVLHDTTEFSFQRNAPGAIGSLSLIKGRHATHTVCGVLMHSSLVLTADGLPLGLAAVKFWTRKRFKGTNALKGRVNLTRIPIEQKESVRWVENLKQSTQLLDEPSRCVHIGDREGDIYELFCAARKAETHFLVRTCVDRLAGRGGTTISKKMAREPVRGEARGRGPGRPGAGLNRSRLPAVLPDDGPPAGRQAEAVPGPVADGDPRPRAGNARGSGTDPVGVTHGPSGGGLGIGGREVGMVRDAVEVGDLS